MSRIDQVRLKAQKLVGKAEAKKHRDAIISAPLNNFDVKTTRDRENIQNAISYFDSITTDTIMWTMADGSEKAVTKSELQEVMSAFVLRTAQAFTEYQEKKQELEAGEAE